MTRRRMYSRRATSSSVYRRCVPASCVPGPTPYRRSQVRSVDGAIPISRATAATVSPPETTASSSMTTRPLWDRPGRSARRV